MLLGVAFYPPISLAHLLGRCTLQLRPGVWLKLCKPLEEPSESPKASQTNEKEGPRIKVISLSFDIFNSHKKRKFSTKFNINCQPEATTWWKSTAAKIHLFFTKSSFLIPWQRDFLLFTSYHRFLYNNNSSIKYYIIFKSDEDIRWDFFMRLASFEVVLAVITARTGGRGIDRHRECETV